MIRHLPDMARTRLIKCIDIIRYFQRKLNTANTIVIFFILIKHFILILKIVWSYQLRGKSLKTKPISPIRVQILNHNDNSFV